MSKKASGVPPIIIEKSIARSKNPLWSKTLAVALMQLIVWLWPDARALIAAHPAEYATAVFVVFTYLRQVTNEKLDWLEVKEWIKKKLKR